MTESEAEAIGYVWGNAGAQFSETGLSRELILAYKRGYYDGVADREIGCRQIANAAQDPLCKRCVELGDGTFCCIGTADLSCGQRAQAA